MQTLNKQLILRKDDYNLLVSYIKSGPRTKVCSPLNF